MQPSIKCSVIKICLLLYLECNKDATLGTREPLQEFLVLSYQSVLIPVLILVKTLDDCYLSEKVEKLLQLRLFAWSKTGQ